MISNKWQILKHTAKLYDLCALVAAFLTATFVLYSQPAGKSLSEFFETRISIGHCLLFALLLLAWHNIFILSGLYVSKRLVQRRTEVLEVSEATLIATAFLFVMGRVLHLKMVMLSFSFVSIMGMECCSFRIRFGSVRSGFNIALLAASHCSIFCCSSRRIFRARYCE